MARAGSQSRRLVSIRNDVPENHGQLVPASFDSLAQDYTVSLNDVLSEDWYRFATPMKSGHHAPPSSAQGLSYPPLPPREDLNTAFANSDMSPEDSEYFRICVDKSQSTLAQNAWQHEVRRKSSPEDSLWYNVWNEPYRHAQFFRMADFMDIDAEEDFAATARFYERLQRRYPCANFMSLPGFVHICTLLHLLLESENELPCDDAYDSFVTQLLSWNSHGSTGCLRLWDVCPFQEALDNYCRWRGARRPHIMKTKPTSIIR
ncbi:hypothetical protein PG985_016001 [Apiospora marii]|uniref:uncharacterized protein n=1 Tax=Apiospora marii TaxID=335849 RepID=UPI00312EF583